MNWYEFVRDNYVSGRYDNVAAAVFVVKNKITAAEYEAITGQLYAN